MTPPVRVAPVPVWQLLTRLLALDPASRPSAAEALLGRYLNSDCTEGELPVTAPEPWTLEGLRCTMGLTPARRLVSDECPLPEPTCDATLVAI